jgi:hypothetical protein
MTRAAPALPAVLFALAVLTTPGEAHKGITTKFTFNSDVYPVFLNRCGRCHIEGGVGPMSLVKYDEAFPWAEAIRAELLSATTGDMHDFVKAAHRQISARELDIVLDWATGGAPEGDTTKTPTPPMPHVDWAAGMPDVVAAMIEPYEMSGETLEATHESIVPIAVSSSVMIGHIDVLPGNPLIVRSAVLSLRAADGTTRLLGTWMPRQVPAAIPLKPPVRVEPGAEIIARIHYKKTWKYEAERLTDRSQVGLYLAN